MYTFISFNFDYNKFYIILCKCIIPHEYPLDQKVSFFNSFIIVNS